MKSLAESIRYKNSYMCAVASDKILDQPFSRNSAPTTPAGIISANFGHLFSCHCSIMTLIHQPYSAFEEDGTIDLLFPGANTELTTYSCSDRVACLIDEHACIVIESDRNAILPLIVLDRPHHNSVPYVTTSDLVSNTRSCRSATTSRS